MNKTKTLAMRFILLCLAILVILLLTFATYSYAGTTNSRGKFVSNARVAQIVKQERERCHRCTEAELLKRINARIERE